MSLDAEELDDSEGSEGEMEIDEEKRVLEEYWRSQLNWVSSAFSQSRDSFLKIVQWFLAISTGTLLWFSGNFDKYKITANINTTTAHVAFMPMKELYFLSLFLLMSSVIGSAFIIIWVYYNQHLSDIALDKFNSCAKEILAKYDLLKTTQDPEKRDKLDEEICYSLGKSKQPFNFAVESKRKVAEVIIDTKTKCVVMLSSVFYVVGVMLGIVYILLFVYDYW
jgi:preprotein translocase subunit SecE